MKSNVKVEQFLDEKKRLTQNPWFVLFFLLWQASFLALYLAGESLHFALLAQRVSPTFRTLYYSCPFFPFRYHWLPGRCCGTNFYRRAKGAGHCQNAALWFNGLLLFCAFFAQT